MKEKFRLEDYQGDYAMHCDVDEKATIFCNFLHDNGKKWRNDVSYKNKTNWKEYKEDTCYVFNSGNYCRKGYFSKSHVILEFDDFDWENEMINNFKVGDWVKPIVSYIGQDGCACNGWDSAYEIEKVNGKDIYLKGIDYPAFEAHELLLICGFVKDQVIGVHHYEDSPDPYVEKFITYVAGATNPFVTIDETGEVTGWKYAQPVVEKKYRPYKETTLDWIDWIGAEVRYKGTNKTLEISYLTRKPTSRELALALKHPEKDKVSTYSLAECFECLVWPDGSVFGEEIE